VGDRFRVRIDAVPEVVAELTPSGVHAIGLAEGTEVWVSLKATEIEVYPA
jgi:molybdopterin-binding protein